MMVYVDDYRAPFGRMRMSHMTADTVDELHAMATKLGLKREWFQEKSTPHYDVSDSMRRKAIAMGARAETCREGALRRLAQRSK